MASVTITDLLMLVALLFVFYFVLNTMLKKKKEEGFQVESSSTNPVKKDKNCSQTSINQSYLNYIFSGVKSIR
jgi:Ca2+/Na+ antiporter